MSKWAKSIGCIYLMCYKYRRRYIGEVNAFFQISRFKALGFGGAASVRCNPCDWIAVSTQKKSWSGTVRRTFSWFFFLHCCTIACLVIWARNRSMPKILTRGETDSAWHMRCPKPFLTTSRWPMSVYKSKITMMPHNLFSRISHALIVAKRCSVGNGLVLFSDGTATITKFWFISPLSTPQGTKWIAKARNLSLYCFDMGLFPWQTAICWFCVRQKCSCVAQAELLFCGDAVGKLRIV